MILYHYDPNGVFVGSGEAPLDRRATAHYGELRYLIPVNSTTVAPPEFDAETELVRWSGGEWTVELRPVPDPEDPEGPPVDPLTLSLSPRQIRLMLASEGLLTQAETILEGLEEPQRTAALIEWQYATEFKRDHPLLLQVAQALELSDTQIDDMWAQAVNL